MHKNLWLAVLLLPMFALAQNATTASAPGRPFSSPLIVAKGRLLNQTAPIPTTTIFTPAHDGFYRLSFYATVIAPTQSDCTAIASYNPGWTDDSGVVNSAPGTLTSGCDYLGPFSSAYVGNFGAVTTVEAKGGTAITYSVDQGGPPNGGNLSIHYRLNFRVRSLFIAVPIYLPNDLNGGETLARYKLTLSGV